MIQQESFCSNQQPSLNLGGGHTSPSLPSMLFNLILCIAYDYMFEENPINKLILV